MSFTFNWPRFSDQFHYDAIQMLNTALNKGTKPPIIADRIEVVELEMGTQPPELEIRDIGDLTVDQFRGIFRLTYAGDAHLVLKTKVQANPLNHKQPDISLMGGARGMLAAKHPLVVPMLLRLSHFKLSSYVVLVVSKQKGITLVFKTDPLQAVDINSTFDSIAVIQNFIQHEIENQLRQMFREDLPGIIHRLSQQWVKAKVEAPYLEKRPPAPPIPQPSLSRKSSQSSLGTRRVRPPSSVAGSARSQSARPFAPHVSSPLSPPPTPAETSTSSHPDLENFDPTYGLRPEGLPAKSVFRSFGSLFVPNKGLADLAEEASDSSTVGAAEEHDEDDEDDEDSLLDEGNSFDFVEWDRTSGSHPPSSAEPAPEYETIPAVGGGTVTRPRILHAQSAGALSIGLPPRSYSQTMLSAVGSPYVSEFGRPREHGTQTPINTDSTSSRGASNPPSRRHSTAPTEQTYVSSTSAPPLNQYQRSHTTYPHPNVPQRASSSSAIYTRRASVSSSAAVSSTSSVPFSSSHNAAEGPSTDAALDTPTLHQLSTLSTSNHTLSPYTRGLAHFTVRSVPPRSTTGSPGGRGVGVGGVLGAAGLKSRGTTGSTDRPKARRKRTYRLGSKGTLAPAASSNAEVEDYFGPQDIKEPRCNSDGDVPPARDRGAASPTPPSEFDVEDMDRYFPAHDASSRKAGRANRSGARPGLKAVAGGSTPTALQNIYHSGDGRLWGRVVSPSTTSLTHTPGSPSHTRLPHPAPDRPASTA